MALTRPAIEMVAAGGAATDTQIKAVAGRLQAKPATTVQQSEILEGNYDQSSGVLTLVFANGQELRVSGFPTLNDIPQGDPGPQGEQGDPGEDGRDGRDGKDGDRGCEGPQGKKGEPGEDGDDGRPGSPGVPGIRGCAGPIGPRGLTGAQGPMGKPGKTGPTGATGPTGPTGPKGPAGEINIIVSPTDPGNVAPGTIWVNPTIDQTDEF